MSVKNIIRNLLPHGVVDYKRKLNEQRNLENLKNTKVHLPKISPNQPDIYNKDGDKMHSFYLQDSLNETNPVSFVLSAKPKYINWDRYNYGLKTHFYSHNHIEKMKDDYAKKKFAYFIESEALLKPDYDILLNDRALATQFNAVFTTSERHLNSLANAKFSPAGGIWYDKEVGGGTLDEKRYQNKSKNISIISSDKVFCELHAKRIELAKILKRDNLADTFGTFDGGRFVKINETLDDYRYSIAIENNVTSFYFTEKIMNCFASQTVPIYIGATKIGDFFNEDGIIQVDIDEFCENPQKILKICSEFDYEQRLPAILDNYNRVKKYSVIEDWLFKNYKDILL